MVDSTSTKSPVSDWPPHRCARRAPAGSGAVWAAVDGRSGPEIGVSGSRGRGGGIGALRPRNGRFREIGAGRYRRRPPGTAALISESDRPSTVPATETEATSFANALTSIHAQRRPADHRLHPSASDWHVFQELHRGANNAFTARGGGLAQRSHRLQPVVQPPLRRKTADYADPNRPAWLASCGAVTASASRVGRRCQITGPVNRSRMTDAVAGTVTAKKTHTHR